jgi:hypothetical protein
LIRCAVPSSKVGSCDSARAAAERDSGVDAAAGFIACAAGSAALAGAAVTSLAGSGGVPEPAMPALWPNAEVVASIVAMATIVILRMFDALGMRRHGADVEINTFGRSANKSGGPIRKCVF